LFLGVEVSSVVPDDLVLAAEELRYAALSIGKITGRIDVEDILDTIFREFCIGK
jgi:tRNA modification GTPase